MESQAEPSANPKKRAERCTKAEHEKRERLVNDLLARGLRDSQIKRLCSVEWGVAPRSVENYICRARERLIEQLSGDKQRLRADAYAFYSGMIEDQSIPARERLRAREALDKLLGLAAPTKVALTDPTGENAADMSVKEVTALPDAVLEVLGAAYDVLQDLKHGHGSADSVRERTATAPVGQAGTGLPPGPQG